MSDHIASVSQCLSYANTRRIEDSNTGGFLAYIRGGRRQGCVLTPRLFSFGFALGCWQQKVGNAGVDLSDGTRTLLDQRFAEQFLLSENGEKHVKRAICLANVGLHLKVATTKVPMTL